MHSSTVTDESLALISKLRKPVTGFSNLTLSFEELEHELSETVVDQLVQHVKHLKSFMIQGPTWEAEIDKQNVVKLATRILEEQDPHEADKIGLMQLSS